MKVITRLSRVKNLRLYAALAILLIVVFQVYWLYSVYESRKSLALEEAQNMLRTAVLEHDRKNIENQLKGLDATGSEVDDVVQQLLKTLKNKQGISIKLSVDGSSAEDSLSRVMLGKLTSGKPKSTAQKEKEIHKALSGPMRMKFRNTDFQVVYNNKSGSRAYPKKLSGRYCETGEVRSEIIDGSQYYYVRFYKLHSFLLLEIWPFLALSIVYLSICIGAVVLLVKNVNQSRKLMQQKDNFTNSMTHEFKTPMATISAAVEALQNYGILDDREMTSEYLDMIKKDIHRLVDMTDAILLNAKMSDGKIPLSPRVVETSKFIGDVCKSLRPILDYHSAELSISSLEKPVIINVDEQHFANVFRNLIDNSIKYSNGPAIIGIEIGVEKNCVRILFSDEGIGIPEKYRSEIFKPYFRVQENNIYTAKGFGLGLHYIRQIVALSHGTIELLPLRDDQKGSIFKILIPLYHD